MVEPCGRERSMGLRGNTLEARIHPASRPDESYSYHMKHMIRMKHTRTGGTHDIPTAFVDCSTNCMHTSKTCNSTVVFC